MSIQDPPQDGPPPAAALIPTSGGDDEVISAPLVPVAPEVAASLTDALRAMYDNVVDEPLPDAFAQLLNMLDDSDAGHGDA